MVCACLYSNPEDSVDSSAARSFHSKSKHKGYKKTFVKMVIVFTFFGEGFNRNITYIPIDDKKK
jgi:hypothetical protein